MMSGRIGNLSEMGGFGRNILAQARTLVPRRASNPHAGKDAGKDAGHASRQSAAAADEATASLDTPAPDMVQAPAYDRIRFLKEPLINSTIGTATV